ANPGESLRCAPVDRATRELAAEPTPARVLGDRDQTDRATLLDWVRVHADVAGGRVVADDEHDVGPAFAASSDPRVVELIAAVVRKMWIGIEARVAVADAGNRPEAV